MIAEVGSVAWARSEVQSAIASLATKAGIDPKIITVTGKMGPAQPRVEITMPWHPYMTAEERIGNYALQAGPSAKRHAKEIAAKLVIPYIRLLERDRQLMAADVKPLVKPGQMRHITLAEYAENPLPAWAYTMSPVALAWMRQEGRKPESVVRLGLQNARDHTHSVMNGYDFEIYGAHTKRFLLDIGRGAIWHDDQHRPQIGITDKLPDTILLALRRYKGRPLSEILSHPLLDQLDLSIAGMDKYGISVVRPPQETIEPVPTELGTPWNTINIE